MELRILGSHNLETSVTKHTCFLVDRSLVIDAGSLMTSLSSAERHQVRSILLTHRHYDHLRDLPSFGLATMDNGVTVTLYGLADTLEALTSHLMDGLLYPDFTRWPSENAPKYRLAPFTTGRALAIAGYEVRPIAVPHGVPAVGYVVRSPEGRSFACSGDTGGGLLPFFRDPWRPDPLLVEVTFSDRDEARALKSGHLTPHLLEVELAQAFDHGLVPRGIVAVHMASDHEDQISAELAGVTSRLGLEITLAREGMTLQI